MNCPICGQDLTVLDLVSATEHVNLCVENGPSVIEIGDSGQIVVKKNVPPGKQRKICPICDKTFQNIVHHFKTCAIKNDVPPDLMLEYWDRINSEVKNPRKFPRELLTGFIGKCVKEGRLGEQVDYARALALSLSEGDPEASNELPEMSDISQASNSEPPASEGPSRDEQAPKPRDITQELLRNAAKQSRPVASRQAQPRPKFRLEMVEESVRRANIALRIDRELAASRIMRYKEAIRLGQAVSEGQILAAGGADDDADDDDDCMIVQDNCMMVSDTKFDPKDLDKLFFRARLKDCTGSELCNRADCEDHELDLLLDEFVPYSGKSMDADPAPLPHFNEQPDENEIEKDDNSMRESERGEHEHEPESSSATN